MLIDYEELPNIRKNHEKSKIVMLKGTFDLFHIGHLNILKRAKALGDILVVIVKCNEAVKLKGEDRPIIDEKERAMIVDAMQYTDYTMIANRIFEWNGKQTLAEQDKLQYERYAKIVQELKPDIAINPTNHRIPDVLLEVYHHTGTRIIEIAPTEGISTTKLIRKIRREEKSI